MSEIVLSNQSFVGRVETAKVVDINRGKTESYRDVYRECRSDSSFNMLATPNLQFPSVLARLEISCLIHFALPGNNSSSVMRLKYVFLIDSNFLTSSTPCATSITCPNRLQASV